MITFKQLLSMSGMENARVVAGESGLNNPIEWCHIIYGADVDEWIKQDVLLLVTGIGLHDIEQDLDTILNEMAKVHGAGIIVETGGFIKSIPDSAVKTADDLHLPTIELPSESNITELTYNIGRLLFNYTAENSLSKTLREIIYLPYQKSMRWQAEKFGYDASLFYIVMAVRIDEDSISESNRAVPNYKKKVEKNILHFVRRELDDMKSHLLYYHTDSTLLLFIPFREESAVKRETTRLVSKIRDYLAATEQNTTVSIGVSKTFSDLSQLRSSVLQAKYALQMLYVCSRTNDIRFYDRIGVYRIFFNYNQDSSLMNLYTRILGELENYDAQYKSELVETLDVYLSCNGNISLTADQLFVHRNTLKYRIKKIQEILRIDFANPNALFTLQLAYKIKKYVAHNIID